MTARWTPSVLLVSDPALGPRAVEIVRRRFPHVEFVLWDINGNRDDTLVRGIVSSRAWEIAFSVHNDLIFSDRELAGMHLPLNLHPALPALPGIGHDIIPLLEQHTEVGVTLHEMETAVDSGTILHVDRIPLGRNTTRSQLRQVIQSRCLQTLAWAADIILEVGSVKRARRQLAKSGHATHLEWGSRLRTRREVGNLVEDVRKSYPESPIFQ